MDQHLIWDSRVQLSLIIVVFTLLYTLCRKLRRRQCTVLSGIEILQLLRRSKLFPLVHGSTWKLYDFCHDLRVWKGHLTSDLSDPVTLYGCYSKVKGSSQVVMKTLKELQKYHEWQPKLSRVTQITRAQEAPPLGPKTKNSPSLPVQHDYIGLETDATHSSIIAAINRISLVLQGEPFVRKLININRFWHREDNGCCWLLEVPETTRPEWTFYLAQPVEEMDQCLLTIVQASGSSPSSQGAQEPAYRLASLQNYFLYKKVQCTPLTTVTLPSAQLGDHAVEEELPTTPVASKTLDDLQSQAKSEPSPKMETNILKRFKNLIEEKKEWYEERKRKSQGNIAVLVPEGQALSNHDSISSAQNIIKDDQQGDSDSDLSDGMEGETTEMTVPTQTLTHKKDQQPKAERKSLLQFLRSSTMSSSLEECREGEAAGDGPLKTSASRAGLSLNLLQRMRSVEGRPENEAEDGEDEGEEDGEDERLISGFRTLGNTVAAEIMTEKVKVSNIDISRSYDEQALQTGGWIYCGLEKEVVILRKVVADGSHMQSYLGKGIIPVPPKAVFEALKNPRTRFTYDEMLKKVEILHDFGGGLKIVYLYHEVSQLFRKEARDFCVLQSERIEGFKYLISLRSVGWPDCAEAQDVSRGKFHSSGWIIEPANRDNKLYSMVTYIVQMELGTSKSNSGYLVEELAAKQPLSIAHLRHYLAPSLSQRPPTATPTNPSLPQKRSAPSTPMGTLAAAAAFASQGAALHKSASLDIRV